MQPIKELQKTKPTVQMPTIYTKKQQEAQEQAEETMRKKIIQKVKNLIKTAKKAGLIRDFPILTWGRSNSTYPRTSKTLTVQPDGKVVIEHFFQDFDGLMKEWKKEHRRKEDVANVEKLLRSVMEGDNLCWLEGKMAELEEVTLE